MRKGEEGRGEERKGEERRGKKEETRRSEGEREREFHENFTATIFSSYILFFFFLSSLFLSLLPPSLAHSIYSSSTAEWRWVLVSSTCLACPSSATLNLSIPSFPGWGAREKRGTERERESQREIREKE